MHTEFTGPRRRGSGLGDRGPWSDSQNQPRRPWAWPPARPACPRGLDEGEEHRKEDEAVGHDEEADAEELLEEDGEYVAGEGEGEGNPLGLGLGLGLG